MKADDLELLQAEDTPVSSAIVNMRQFPDRRDRKVRQSDRVTTSTAGKRNCMYRLIRNGKPEKRSGRRIGTHASNSANESPSTPRWAENDSKCTGILKN